MSDNDHESRNRRLYLGDMIEFSDAVFFLLAQLRDPRSTTIGVVTQWRNELRRE